MYLHVFPILNPPSRLPPIPSLWVIPVHPPRALVSCLQPGLAICFTLDNIHVSVLFPQLLNTKLHLQRLTASHAMPPLASPASSCPQCLSILARKTSFQFLYSPHFFLPWAFVSFILLLGSTLSPLIS